MSLTVNGTSVSAVKVNGSSVSSVVVNGTVAWTSAVSPFQLLSGTVSITIPVNTFTYTLVGGGGAGGHPGNGGASTIVVYDASTGELVGSVTAAGGICNLNTNKKGSTGTSAPTVGIPPSAPSSGTGYNNCARTQSANTGAVGFGAGGGGGSGGSGAVVKGGGAGQYLRGQHTFSGSSGLRLEITCGAGGLASKSCSTVGLQTIIKQPGDGAVGYAKVEW